MKQNGVNKELIALLIALIGMAGGFGLVYMQTHDAAKESKANIQAFKEAVQSSEELRNAVLRPLEGRWKYELAWDKYFRRDVGSEADQAVIVSEGTADIRWSGDAYHVLLGYENRDDNTGQVFSVAVNIGTLRTTGNGQPAVGDRIIMRYAHRLSAGVVQTDGEEVDYSRVPEKTYDYEITGIERNADGEIIKITALFEVEISKGTVVFIKEQ